MVNGNYTVENTARQLKKLHISSPEGMVHAIQEWNYAMTGLYDEASHNGRWWAGIAEASERIIAALRELERDIAAENEMTKKLITVQKEMENEAVRNRVIELLSRKEGKEQIMATDVLPMKDMTLWSKLKAIANGRGVSLTDMVEDCLRNALVNRRL
jgi:hypothetical protein